MVYGSRIGTTLSSLWYDDVNLGLCLGVMSPIVLATVYKGDDL